MTYTEPGRPGTWRIVIHRKGGLFRFVLRDGFLSEWEAQRAKTRIWKRLRIRWLKVERQPTTARRDYNL